MVEHRDPGTWCDAVADQQTETVGQQRWLSLDPQVVVTAQPDQPGQREPGRIPKSAASPALRQPVMGIDTRSAAKDAATVAVPDEPAGVCSVTPCGFPLRNGADRRTPARHLGAVNQLCPPNDRGRTLHRQDDGSESAVHIY